MESENQKIVELLSMLVERENQVDWLGYAFQIAISLAGVFVGYMLAVWHQGKRSASEC